MVNLAIGILTMLGCYKKNARVGISTYMKISKTML